MCPNCRFKPQTDVEEAKALILSLDYEIDGQYRGKTKEELQSIAASIKDGVPYAFDEAEVQSVITYAQQVQSIPSRTLIVDGLKWIGPPVAIFVIVCLLLFLDE